MRSSPWILIALALVMVGCSKDADEDGYKSDSDCNDDDDAIHPGAPELCDGVDNDCDDKVDEGVEGTWYLDADSDGYGDPDEMSRECGRPEGYVDNSEDCDDTSPVFRPGATEDDCTDPNDYNCDGSTGFVDADGDGWAACEDCDDSDADIHPDAPEVCDGIDNDCNQVVDLPAVDAPDWYIDYDHDMYGSDAFIITQCEQPGGYVDNADDCDDYEALAHPGGTEVCDGLDNDCDGTTDGPDSQDAVVAYTDADGDGYGDGSTETLACELEGGLVGEAGDCDDTNLDVNPAALEVCGDGMDNDCDSTWSGCSFALDDADTLLLGEDPGDYAGRGVSAGGDLNGDGFADIAVGAEANDAGAEGTEGAAYVLFGAITAGNVSLSAADVTLAGIGGGDQAGYLVSATADFDLDGIDDLFVNAPSASDTGTTTGSVYLVRGSTLASAGSGSEISLEDADFTWSGSGSYHWFGGDLSNALDVNGDGATDFLCRAAGNDEGESNAGAFYVLPGGTGYRDGGSALASAARLTILGVEKSAGLGSRVAGGDLDGDGYDDLFVGVSSSAANGVSSGALYVVDGQSRGSMSLDDADARMWGTDAGDKLGASVAKAGDANGDGYVDLLAGATSDDEAAAAAGAIYLIPGSATLSSLDSLDADSVAAGKVLGAESQATLGSVVGADGDFDGDGVVDLLAGNKNEGVADEGAVWLFLGPVTGIISAATDYDAMMVGDSTDDHNGSTVLFGGDLFGTGGQSIVVAGWEDDGAGLDAGTVFVIGSLGL